MKNTELMRWRKERKHTVHTILHMRYVTQQSVAANAFGFNTKIHTFANFAFVSFFHSQLEHLNMYRLPVLERLPAV